jgi:hypothetical protein
MPEAPNHWFRAKRYGWGWGLPTAWQGWVVLALYTAAIAALGLALMPAQPGGFVLGTVVATLALVVVCWLKGEPPRWRWGGDRR